MQKRASAWGWSVLGVGIVSVIGALLFVFGSYDFKLTEDQIREKLAAVLPLGTDGVAVDTVAVDLSSSDNSVDIVASGRASQLGQEYTFTISTVGVPEYHWTSGEFYFRPTRVSIDQIEQTGGATLEEDINTLRDFATDLFPQREAVIDELAYAGEQLAPEVTTWLQGRAETMAVYFLARAPIYTLPNDAKGIAAQAVLDSVVVAQDELVVTLTLYRLGIWVLLFGGLAIISIGIVVSGRAQLFVAIGSIGDL
jgi:hypothetical protein